LQCELLALLNNFPPGSCQIYYHHGTATPSFQPDHHGMSELGAHTDGPVVSKRRTGQGNQRTSTRQITGLITPQNLRLQAQVKLASLGWCHKSRNCASFCTFVHVFLQSERWRCQYWSAYLAGVIMWMRQGGRKVCETRAENCQVIWLGICVCNTAILCVGLHENCDV
jgi:hypothetical protein